MPTPTAKQKAKLPPGLLKAISQGKGKTMTKSKTSKPRKKK
jgi:hypothetical protein